MKSSVTQNSEFTKLRNQKLLAEFKQVANKTYPNSGLSPIASSLKVWLGLEITSLIQKLGYNKKKITQVQDKQIFLNVGCQGSKQENSHFLDTDLLIGRQIFQFLLGKLDYDLLLNLTYRDKNLSNVADGILVSHVLEHLPPTSVITALENCFDYLKVGGCIRVSVPSLKMYDQPNFLENQHVKTDDLLLAKNLLFYGWGHKFMYEKELMTVLMEEAGFSQIKIASYGEGLLGDQDPLKHKHESIYLTGIKS